MTEHHDTLKAYDEAGEQISKLQFLQAILATDDYSILGYEGAMTGMYYILEDAIGTLRESTDVLYEAAMEGKAKEPETAEDTDGGEDQAATKAETAEEDRSE